MADPEPRMNPDAVLAEYQTVRTELQQLNGQVFSTLSGSLTLNAVVLGWFFSRDKPGDFYLLPTIGIVILFVGGLILLNRNRLAHRLALFQKYFIEPRLPDICWGRIYFEYRELYDRTGKVSEDSARPKRSIGALRDSWAERLADSAVYVLLIVGVVNVAVLVVFAVNPYFTSGSTTVDWAQVGNLAVAVTIIWSLVWLRRVMTNYDPVNRTMLELATQCGLTRGCTGRPPEASAGGRR